MEDILKMAKSQLQRKQQRVLFTECTDERILVAAHRLQVADICKPVLLGVPEEIQISAEQINVSLDGMEIIDETDVEQQRLLAQNYHKLIPNFSEKVLLRKMKKSINMGAMLVKIGQADCLAAGVVLTTESVILAAHQYIGLANMVETVSSIGFQIAKRFDNNQGLQLLGVADCAVCANPTVEQLASIATISADSYQRILNRTARVAMISYSTLGSSEGPLVDKIQAATKLAKKRRPDLLIEGEYQLDAALMPKIAKHKVTMKSSVAGRANVLIFLTSMRVI
jgi:Phosphotransacetylase